MVEQWFPKPKVKGSTPFSPEPIDTKKAIKSISIYDRVLRSKMWLCRKATQPSLRDASHRYHRHLRWLSSRRLHRFHHKVMTATFEDTM